MKHYTVNINAKLRPMDRGEIFEDPLNEILERGDLGIVDGGGSLMAKNGEIENCDIEVELNETSSETRNQLLRILAALHLPKGSALISEDAPREAIGDLEGLALYLNGTDLPVEVYETSDVNLIIDELNGLLGSGGKLFSWWQGPQETALYFYGASFAKMQEIIAPFLNAEPLCQKCRVVQIA